MSLADTQRLIERTEGILTLHVLRDNRQFLVNIPDIEGSQSDSSCMDGEGTRWQGQGPNTQHKDCMVTNTSSLLMLQISLTLPLNGPIRHPPRPPRDLHLPPG